MTHNPIDSPAADISQPSRLSNGQILLEGARKAVTSAWWVFKILIPISFLTMLLQFSRLLDHLDSVLGPLMGVLHLPAKAVMPLIAGVLTGIYGSVAAMAVLDLSHREAALIAIFLLISHNIIQESAVQGLAGMHPLKAAGLRLTTSVVVVWTLGLFWPAEPIVATSMQAVTVEQSPFLVQLKSWGWETLVLCLKVMAILVCIMTAVTWMKARNIIQRLVRILTPVLKTMGLGTNEGILWLTAVLFGITYGSAVIIEEVRQGNLTYQELERLHLSIGINHAMIEDPAMFLSLGVHPFWLWVPRLVAALISVHLLRLLRFVRRKRSVGATNEN